MVDHPQVFLPLSYLTRQASRPYYSPLDWDTALVPTSPGATLEYKLMRNAKAAGYFDGRVLDATQSVCLFETFYVLDNGKYAWFQKRVFNNPDFEVERVGDFATDRQLWLVRRLSNSAACSAP